MRGHHRDTKGVEPRDSGSHYNGSETLRRVLLSMFLLFSIGFGQYYYFGKNKVQYKDFPFSRLTTNHFDIYFYPGGEPLAEFAKEVLEEAYSQLSEGLHHQIKNRIPLILYNCPNDFAQTNVTLQIIEEAVGGFSELFKNRMVVPFNGDYKEFKHVLIHELVHIFQFDIFYPNRLANLLSLIPSFTLPLWVMEGMAEFFSQHGGLSSSLFMRDLVLREEVLPIQELTDDSGYLVYREGESIFLYMEEKYGREKVFDFIHSLKAKRNLDSAFKQTFGLSTKEFSKRWEGWLKLKYWPQIKKKPNFDKIARLLTEDEGYNTQVTLSKSGTKIAFVTNRNDYTDIYVISAIDGKVLKHLIRGERILGFEQIPILKSGLTFSPDEKSIVFITKESGRDVITFCRYPSGKIYKKIKLELDGIYGLSFSPKGDKLAFYGIKDGFSDIYLLDPFTEELERLTYDPYDDKDPSFSPDGKGIIFASDRPDSGDWEIGSYAVFEYREGEIKRITKRLGDCGFPVYDPDGEHLYLVIGDSTSYNVAIYSLKEGKVIAKSDFLGGVGFLSLSGDGRRLAFSYQTSKGSDVGIIEDPKRVLPKVSEFKPPTLLTSRYHPKGLKREEVKPYSLSFTPDYAIGGVSYTTGYGAAGTIELALSDLLGNHRIWFASDLWRDIRYSNIFFDYWYLPKRIDIGVEAFQYFLTYGLFDGEWIELLYSLPDTVLSQKNLGIGIFLSYPVNKFVRFELGTQPVKIDSSVYAWNEGYYWLIRKGSEWLLYLDGALVFDNALFFNMGPLRGARARFEVYGTLPPSSENFYIGILDYRHYFRFYKRYIFASRLLGVSCFGRDRRTFLWGGDLVRGYEYGEFYSSMIGITNLELRFPFIDKPQLNLLPIPIRFPPIRGVAFLDCGLGYSENIRIYDPEEWTLEDLKVGVGAGLRMMVYYFILKFDIAKPLSTTQDPGLKFYFNIGTDF